MKKILFASTAFAGLAIAGVASADVALFGTARLGIGYNIQNNGSVDLDDEANEDGVIEATDDLRAISRIRFGFTGTGETDSGITFGATIRADNAKDGGTGDTSSEGTLEGNVFVSGAWGTLTYGDTNGADEQHVGDANGQLSVTGLGDFNETPFISNGGGFGDDDSIQFANNADARPTVRYDYNFGGFGVSASTNRDLNDIGVGASYTVEFAGGSVTGGLGYYDFSQFDTVIEGIDFDGEEGDDTLTFKGGEQYSVGATGTFGGFSGGVVYSAAKSESDSDLLSGDLDVLNLGVGYTFDAWSVSAYYAKVLTGNGNLEAYDGLDSYGASVAYDLGGGAAINFGVAQTYGRNAESLGTFGTPPEELTILEVEDSTVADFGITMAF